MTTSLRASRSAPQRLPAWIALGLVSALGCGSLAPEGAQAPEDVVLDTEHTSLSALASTSRVIRPQQQTGLCLEPARGALTNGTPVVLAACNQGATQIWAHPDATFRVGGNHCLDVADGKNQNGAKLQLWDCDSNNVNQKFTISATALKWQNTDKCFDVTDGALRAGTPIQMWQCDGGNNNQKWSLVTTSPGSQDKSSVGSDAGGRAKYFYTKGTQIIAPNDYPVVLKGTNIGGWLVTENWMNGYTDSTDPAGRFSLETLERRFGSDRAWSLINIWYDKFINTKDLDRIKDMGLNVIRVPFGYRNLQRADGSWIKNSAGNIDFGRLDWIVDEAAKRGIYTILDFHIWDTQQADYSLISTNTDGGRASQAKAAAIWKQVARHYKGNANIVAYDIINEPTGSWGNLMQDALYKAVRAEDQDRIIIMESMSADPASLGWKQVVYSIHQYGMMGNDFEANKASFNSEFNDAIKSFWRFNIPAYVGEFMVQQSGPTLPWLLGQYVNERMHWTNWTYKTVNMGAWGFCNLPDSARVNILNDSYEKIESTWRNLGDCTLQTPLVDTIKRFNGR